MSGWCYVRGAGLESQPGFVMPLARPTPRSSGEVSVRPGQRTGEGKGVNLRTSAVAPVARRSNVTAWLYGPSLPRAVALLAASYLAYYLWWRFSVTLNPEALGLSLLLVAAELHGGVNHLLFSFMTWDTERQAPFQLRADLKVDIYVPTYNEDL